MMRSNTPVRAVLFAVGVLFAAGSAGQQTPPAPPAPKAAKPAKPAAKAAVTAARMELEPRAIEILKASSARLAAARTMKFTAIVSYESASRVGPAIVYTTRSDIVLQRPDKLRIITPGDGPTSEFYYDGKVIMAFAPAENLVAVADAPPTIDAALQFANASAAIFFPFTDVMVADPYRDIEGTLRVAFYVGQSNVVGGTTTDMVVFASDEVFVQIWIGTEDKLPRQFRAVYRNDRARFRHQMELSNWQIDSEIAPGTFTTKNALSAARIAFAHPAPPPPAAKLPMKSKPVKPPPAKAQ
jgi:hypothetical protein